MPLWPILPQHVPDVGKKVRILTAFSAQEIVPLRRGRLASGVKEFIDPAASARKSCEGHAGVPPSWLWSQARAARQSRFTVRT